MWPRSRKLVTRMGHEQRTVEVLRQFRLVYGAVRRHSRQVEQACGMSGARAWLLREVEHSPGLGVSELAERLSIHSSTTSQLVEKLARGGYVVKERSPADQRRVGLRLATKGKTAIAHAPCPAEGVLPRALMYLSKATLRSLHASLELLLQQIGEAHAEDASNLLSDL